MMIFVLAVALLAQPVVGFGLLLHAGSFLYLKLRTVVNSARLSGMRP